ncbi:hypothetical protein F4777DRAFT_33545 [Nemania sp. FL0916]|nr:hypothetical protein F4777DRAFT_33545 [Nemania sp. FL0916]
MASLPNSIYAVVDRRRGAVPATEERPERFLFYDNHERRAITPKGFPSMASMQAQWSNSGTFRIFEQIHWQMITYYQTKLSQLEYQIHELDSQEDEKLKGSQRSKLPFDKRQFMDCYIEESRSLRISEPLETAVDTVQDEINDTREKLYAEWEQVAKNYRENVYWVQQISRVPRVNREVQRQLLTAAQEQHGLSGEALDSQRAIDDIGCINSDPIVAKIESIWLSAAPWIRKLLRYLFMRNSHPEHGHTQTYHTLEVHGFGFPHRALITLLSSSLVLVPIGILYLGDLTKPLCYTVVVVSGIVFAIVLIIIEQRIGYTLVGVVAYVAVLATLLDTLSQA